jgi:hypothetical protein
MGLYAETNVTGQIYIMSEKNMKITRERSSNNKTLMQKPN